MTRTDVQRLYRVAGGRWWGPFRAQWELFWARSAVRDLDALLRRYVSPTGGILDVGCGTAAGHHPSVPQRQERPLGLLLFLAEALGGWLQGHPGRRYAVEAP
jgi:hypothetical protein